MTGAAARRHGTGLMGGLHFERVRRRRTGAIVRGGRALCGLMLLGMCSCAGPNLWTDLTSVSTGRTNRGRIRKPAKLSMRGAGWVVPARWKERRFQYGVDELVAAVERAARRVHARDRRAVLGVADLSRKTGGRSMWHRSHHSGRDVDLLFYTTDPRGRPMKPPEHEMIRFDAQGQPFVGSGDEAGYRDPRWQERRFDTARNWQLIEALLTDPSIRVQWVFVSSNLKARLLTHARQVKRPRWIVAYADAVMHQPGNALPHDDHFHVRIYCTRGDRFHGCEDRGVVWQHEKKTFDYGGPERYDPVLWQLLLGRRASMLL
jgi:penicillin-insensitive murein DD-endopeptidase